MLYEVTGNYYKDTLKKLMMRTFVAVEISEGGVIELISKFQAQAGIDAKPVEPHNLHFTLQFLGELRADAVEKVRQALQAVEFSKFVVNFKGVGAFPGLKFPRIIWIGTSSGREELQGLAGKVGQALAPLGFSSGRPFKPHVTVFRTRGKAGDMTGSLGKFESVEFGSQRVTSIRLKQSVLTPTGPEYSDLEEVLAVQ